MALGPASVHRVLSLYSNVFSLSKAGDLGLESGIWPNCTHCPKSNRGRPADAAWVSARVPCARDADGGGG